MQAVIDEILEKVRTFTDEERDKLIEVLQTDKTQKENENKGYVSPDTIWVKENRAKYAGNYVALKNGKLVAVGKTIKEADMKAKEKGVKKPLLTYLFPVGEIPFGGW